MYVEEDIIIFIFIYFYFIFGVFQVLFGTVFTFYVFIYLLRMNRIWCGYFNSSLQVHSKRH